MNTTPEHFEFFKEQCRGWIDYLELNNWQVHFKHKTYEDNVAAIRLSLESHDAICYLCTEWDESVRPLNEEEIAYVAKHEILHLLLARVTELGGKRYVAHDTLQEAEEELVKKLARYVSGPLLETELDPE